MGTPLIGYRIPRMKGLEHWAKEPCELCNKELGYEQSIRLGRGSMGYQHAMCAVDYAVKMLREIEEHPEHAAARAFTALGVLGVRDWSEDDTEEDGS